MDRMDQWRNGLISDSEIMTYLLSDLIEVKIAIQERETTIADQRIAKLFTESSKRIDTHGG